MARRTTLISEEYLKASLAFHPDGMLAVLADAHAMAFETQQFAAAMRARYARACECPLHPAIKEVYQSVAAHQRTVAAHAAEIAPMIERLHRDELERLRNPRSGEPMWDVASNRDGQ